MTSYSVLNTYDPAHRGVPLSTSVTHVLRGTLGGKIVSVRRGARDQDRIYKLGIRILLGALLFTVLLPYTAVASCLLIKKYFNDKDLLNRMPVPGFRAHEAAKRLPIADPTLRARRSTRGRDGDAYPANPSSSQAPGRRWKGKELTEPRRRDEDWSDESSVDGAQPAPRRADPMERAARMSSAELQKVLGRIYNRLGRSLLVGKDLQERLRNIKGLVDLLEHFEEIRQKIAAATRDIDKISALNSKTRLIHHPKLGTTIETIEQAPTLVVRAYLEAQTRGLINEFLIEGLDPGNGCFEHMCTNVQKWLIKHDRTLNMDLVADVDIAQDTGFQIVSKFINIFTEIKLRQLANENKIKYDFNGNDRSQLEQRIQTTRKLRKRFAQLYNREAFIAYLQNPANQILPLGTSRNPHIGRDITADNVKGFVDAALEKYNPFA